MAVITELNATNYVGRFAYEGATGNFNCNGQKKIQNISGNKDGIGSFDAYRMGAEDFSYNLHPASLEQAGALATIAGGSVAAVQEELDSE